MHSAHHLRYWYSTGHIALVLSAEKGRPAQGGKSPGRMRSISGVTAAGGGLTPQAEDWPETWEQFALLDDSASGLQELGDLISETTQ